MTLAYLELCSHHLNLILEPYKETLKKKKKTEILYTSAIILQSPHSLQPLGNH